MESDGQELTFRLEDDLYRQHPMVSKFRMYEWDVQSRELERFKTRQVYRITAKLRGATDLTISTL
jgi:hypothetical protein